MKIDLRNTTFVILVRLDSLERLENTIFVANTIVRKFDTNVYVLEAGAYCNNILKKMLAKTIMYKFVEDLDPILHKTMYYNMMIKETDTPFFAIWDVDTAVDCKAIVRVLSELQQEKADIAYPYNGIFMDTGDILRKLYMKKKDISSLGRNQNKMRPLYNRIIVGGAVFFNRKKFYEIGMDNEEQYGWGNDDFDRFYRARNYGLKIYNADNVLFHLSHPRSLNSQYRSFIQQQESAEKLKITEYLSKNEIIKLKE